MQKKSNSPAGIDFKFIFKVAGTLLVICACMAFLLAAVNSITADKIAENMQKEINNAIKAIFPDSTDSITLAGDFSDEISMVFEIKQNKEQIGYCLNLASAGFGGAVNMMIGVDNSGEVVGVKIVSHSETPGLGNRIEGADFISQFVGKSGSLNIKSDVDAITGATISSKAVLNGVNSALSAVADIIAAKEGDAQ